MKATKTNACRALEALGIDYELVAYDGDPTTMDPATLSAAIGQPAPTIYKTLVVQGDKSGASIAVVSIAEAVDLRALAKVNGDKKVELADLRRLFALTGYVRGGVTALATKRPMPVVLDKGAMTFDRIGVSGGAKGIELLLRPEDYVRATGATVAAIARPS